MTASELIQELQKHKPDTPVVWHETLAHRCRTCMDCCGAPYSEPKDVSLDARDFRLSLGGLVLGESAT